MLILKDYIKYIENNLIDSDDSMYLAVDSLIGINNITIDSNNVDLRKANLKPCRYSKIYMDKDLIEDKLYKLVDQFNEIKINDRGFNSTFYIYFYSIFRFRLLRTVLEHLCQNNDISNSLEFLGWRVLK